MKNNSIFSPLLKIFKEEDNVYAYDAGSGLLCEIDTDTATALSNQGGNTPIPLALKKAQEQNFFKFREMQRCTIDLAEIPKFIQHNLEHVFPQRFILEVTENCNLRCKYCPNTIGNRNRIHANKQMDTTTAYAAIDYYFNTYKEKILKLAPEEQKKQAQKVPPNISWWGGEPFLNFEVIKKSKEYFENLPWDTIGISKETLKYSVVSNLTIFNPEIMEFLVSNRINLFVSLDGDKCLHDANRVFVNGQGSFNIVKNNLDLLYSSAPDYCLNHVGIHAVYGSNDTLPIAKKFFEDYFYDSQKKKKFSIILYLYQLRPEKEMNFSTKARNKKQLLETFRQKTAELSLLTEEELNAKITNCEIDIQEYVNLLDLEKNICPETAQATDQYNKLFSCPIGAEMIYVGINGNLHSCHKTDNSYPIGNVKDDGVNPAKLVQLYRNYLPNFQKRCNKCWAFRLCKKCPAQTLNKGHFSAVSRAECAYTRRMYEIEIQKYILFIRYKELYNNLKKI